MNKPDFDKPLTRADCLQLQPDQEAKADAGKPRFSLLAMYPMMEAISRVREFGCRKYTDPENWKRVERSRYKDALLRHIIQWADDEASTDEESGLSHLWHAACNMMFIMWLDYKNGVGRK